MSKLLTHIIKTFRSNLRPYFVICIVAYGIFVAGMVYSYFHPIYAADQRTSLVSTMIDRSESVFQDIVNQRTFPLFLSILIHNLLAYAHTMLLPWLFISLTGAKVFITGPFYAGMIFGLPSLANIRIYGVALLEFQAEIFAILAAYVFATRLLLPKLFAIANYKKGVIVAIRSYLELSLFVPAFFVLAAGYEAWSITSLIPQNPFPSTYDSQFALHSKHTNAIINFNNQQIYYDSTMLQVSDAKIAQIVLHDVGYFGPLSIYRDSLHYSIKISLSEANWGKQETIRRLTAAATRLKGSFASRQYEIVACSRDSLDNWREKSLANP